MNTRKLFWILFFLNLFNYIDRQVLFSVFPLIQQELHISDFQLGFLASVFMVVYMCYAPIVGFFADRHPRQYWIASSALIWSGATFLSGFVQNYTSLLTTRSFIGIGEGGFTTIAQPFLAEQYPKNKRATILSYFGLALPAGSALGYLLGAVIGASWGWRVAFMMVGVPGFLLGLLTFFHIKDREHRHLEKRKKPGLSQYFTLLKNTPFLLLCLGHAMQTFTLGGLSAWMPTYFHRFFDLGIAQAGTLFGIMVILAGALGTFIGGKLSDKFLQKTNSAHFIVILASFITFIPFAAIGVISSSLPLTIFSFFLAITFIFMPLGPISASLVALSGRKVRSMAFALNIFLIHALGDAISPALIGRISDAFGLAIAVLSCSAVMLPASILMYYAAKFARAEGRLIRYYAEDCAE